MYKKILFISLKTPSSCGLMNILKHMLAIFKHKLLNSCGDAKPFFKWGGGRERNHSTRSKSIIQSLFGPTYICYKFLYQILKHCEQG